MSSRSYRLTTLEWHQMTPPERLLIREAMDGHSLIDALNAWTVATSDAANWNSKSVYVPALAVAAASLIESSKLVLRDSEWREVATEFALDVVRTESSWWSPLDDESEPNFYMYFLDIPSEMVVELSTGGLDEIDLPVN